MENRENGGCIAAFGEFVKAGRKAKGYTQVELAELLGIHQTTVKKTEKGQRGIDLTAALKICRVLDLDLADFIKTQI